MINMLDSVSIIQVLNDFYGLGLNPHSNSKQLSTKALLEMISIRALPFIEILIQLTIGELENRLITLHLLSELWESLVMRLYKP